MNLEGRTVSYVGDPRADLAVGDRGRVLSSNGDCCHVMWATGASTGQVSLLPVDEVVVGRRQAASAPTDPLEDSLAVPSLSAVAVVETFDAEGPAGLLNALAEAGMLASFAQIAEEAVTHVAARLCQDEEFRAVLGQLDPEDGSELVSLASAVLLRDAFGGETDG